MASLLVNFIASRIRKGVLTLIDVDGSQSSFGTSTPGYPEVTLRIHDSKAIRRIILDPRIGFGEAYMDGQVTVDGEDVMGLVQLIRANAPWDKGGSLQPFTLRRKLKIKAKRALGSANTRIRSRTNVAHHYDLSNDFYTRWLDPEMQYSCAYWGEGVETLEEAQRAKLAHIAAKLNLSPGQTVLDIGCGWGGMARYLNRVADVDVLGITLSTEQLAFARERAERDGVSDRVKFALVDYRALAETGKRFDRIVSVGMFEHVGHSDFLTFFRSAANLLNDDGVMLLHTIGRMGSPGVTDAFTDKYIFPGGYIPALSETVEASEKVRLIVADIENLRLHYARTLRQWYARVLADKDFIIGKYDERFYRMWTFYLSGATAAFESGSMCNFQIQYIRDRHALPITRNWMTQEEDRLRAIPWPEDVART